MEHEPTRLPSRLSAGCLLLLVTAMPLVPSTDLPVAKHAVWLCLALLGGLLVGWAGLSGRRAPALGTPVDIALGCFLLSALPAALAAQKPGAARYEVGLLLAAGLTYLLAIHAVRTPRDVARLGVGALGATAVIAVSGLLAYHGFLRDAVSEAERSARLATPFFAHSYLAAQYLVMVAAGALVFLVRGRPRGATGAAIAVVLVAALAFLLVIGSRGAWLALGGAVLLSVALVARTPGAGARGAVQRAALVGGLLLVALLVAAVAGLVPGAFAHAWERLTGPWLVAGDDPGVSRVAIWRDTLRMSADHLLFGVGPGGFDTAIQRYHVAARAVPHAHNQFLHVLAELGLVGLVALVFLLRHAAHAVRKGAWFLARDEARSPLFHAAAAALLAATGCFLFETPLRWAEAGSLILVALAVVTRAGCTREERPGQPGRVLAGAALAAVLAGLAWPAWVAFGRASQAALGAVRHHEAARTAAARQQPATARAELQRALDGLRLADELWPWRSDFVALRGDLLALAGHPEEALAAARLADLRVPGSFRHQFAIGVLQLRLQRPELALEPLRGAIAAWQGPESLDAYVLLGRAYYACRRFEEAWLVFFDLLARRWHHQRPELLVDATRCLLNLDRNLDQAATMLAQYRRRAGDTAELPYLAELEAELARQRDRPRRVTRIVAH